MGAYDGLSTDEVVARLDSAIESLSSFLCHKAAVMKGIVQRHPKSKFYKKSHFGEPHLSDLIEKLEEAEFEVNIHSPKEKIKMFVVYVVAYETVGGGGGFFWSIEAEHARRLYNREVVGYKKRKESCVTLFSFLTDIDPCGSDPDGITVQITERVEQLSDAAIIRTETEGFKEYLEANKGLDRQLGRTREENKS